MLFAKTPQHAFGLIYLIMGFGGIDNGGFQYLPGSVHHCQLTPSPVRGVKAQSDLILDRRLHQKRPKVQGKGVDGLLVCHLRQIIADLPFQRGKD